MGKIVHEESVRGSYLDHRAIDRRASSAASCSSILPTDVQSEFPKYDLDFLNHDFVVKACCFAALAKEYRKIALYVCARWNL